MASARFFQEGKSIDYTPASAVAAGDIIVQNGIVGVAKLAIAASTLGALCTEGIIEIAKKNEAFVAGLPVWLDANGNPKVGTTGSGAATQLGKDGMAAADVLLGTCIKAAAAADAFCYVALNKFDPRIPTFANAKRIAEPTDGNAVVTDSGAVYEVTTDTKVVTLPATAVGLEFTIMNMAADGAALVEVNFQSGDKNLGGCGVAAGADGKKLSNTKATAKKGDFITFVADGTDGYRIKAIRGTWAQE